MVATQMQTDIRSKYAHNMDASDTKKFADAYEQGKLLKPEQPGNVMGRLALKAEKGLSGEFVQWNDERLKEYQD